MNERDQIEQEIIAGIERWRPRPASSMPTVGRVMMIGSICAALLIALTQSAASQRTRMPKIEGCATPKQLMSTFFSDKLFRDALPIENADEAARISYNVGLAVPPAQKIVFKFMRGTCHSVYSLVGEPVCWIKQDFCLVMKSEPPTPAPPTAEDERQVQQIEKTRKAKP